MIASTVAALALLPGVAGSAEAARSLVGFQIFHQLEGDFLAVAVEAERSDPAPHQVRFDYDGSGYVG